MKASEAILILKALSPDHEVTLDIGVRKIKPVEPIRGANAYLPGQMIPAWQGQFWPNRNEITCKLH